MKALYQIAQTLAHVEDAQLIERFLKSLFTDKEANDVASRWKLVRLLDEGMSQRAISQKLGLSLCKITRGSKELKKQNSPFKQLIDI